MPLPNNDSRAVFSCGVDSRAGSGAKPVTVQGLFGPGCRCRKRPRSPVGRSSAVPHPHGVRNQPGSGRPQVWGIPLASSLLSPMVWRGHDRLFTQPRAATSAVYGGSLAPLGLGCLPHSLQSGQGWAASVGHLMNEPPSQRLHAQRTMPPPASIGQEVDGETLVFTVTRVSTAKTVQDTSYETKTAKGIYVIVTMTLKNNTGTAAQMFGSDQVLRGSAGWQFSAGGNNNDNSSSVVQKGPAGVDIVEPAANLDPPQEMTVGVMFDVPEGTKPSQIVLKEMRPGNNPPLENPYGMVVNLS